MKRTVFRTVPSMIFALLLAGCASTGSKLPGSWRMLDEQGAPTDKTKLLTEDRFAFGEQLGPDGIWAGGGTWKFQDGYYFETIEYHSTPAVVGHTVRFDCELIDGKWHHTGEVRLEERTIHVSEVWERIDD